MIHLEGIDHIALIVRDVERSAKWYQDVLGLERWFKGRWDGIPTFVGIGSTGLALFPSTDPNPKPRPGRDVIAMRHFAFRTSRKGFSEAQVVLRAKEISFRFADHEVAHSIYFFDPDGHEIEITTYEI